MLFRTLARLRLAFLGLALLAVTGVAHASMGLLVGEPFGSFGTMMPVGHAGVTFDHLCAETPTRLRMCRPGEMGVVISRYHDLRVTNIDWVAMPVVPFLYGVEDVADVPGFVTASLEAELRESYREAHLRSVVPDRIDRRHEVLQPLYGDWEEGIGAAFDRRLLLYEFETTPEQDAAMLELLNGDANKRRYTLRRENCADFAAELIGDVLPGVFHRAKLADFDMTTPKGLARQMDAYGQAHAEIGLRVYEIPQLPGTLRRSRPLRGSAETFVKTKRYLATLIAIQPEAILADWIVYEAKGKWRPGVDATVISPGDWAGRRVGGSMASSAE
jgi:hypothetical protein